MQVFASNQQPLHEGGFVSSSAEIPQIANRVSKITKATATISRNASDESGDLFAFAPETHADVSFLIHAPSESANNVTRIGYIHNKRIVLNSSDANITSITPSTFSTTRSPASQHPIEISVAIDGNAIETMFPTLPDFMNGAQTLGSQFPTSTIISALNAPLESLKHRAFGVWVACQSGNVYFSPVSQLSLSLSDAPSSETDIDLATIFEPGYSGTLTIHGLVDIRKHSANSQVQVDSAASAFATQWTGETVTSLSLVPESIVHEVQFARILNHAIGTTLSDGGGDIRCVFLPPAQKRRLETNESLVAGAYAKKNVEGTIASLIGSYVHAGPAKASSYLSEVLNECREGNVTCHESSYQYLAIMSTRSFAFATSRETSSNRINALSLCIGLEKTISTYQSRLVSGGDAMSLICSDFSLFQNRMIYMPVHPTKVQLIPDIVPNNPITSLASGHFKIGVSWSEYASTTTLYTTTQEKVANEHELVHLLSSIATQSQVQIDAAITAAGVNESNYPFPVFWANQSQKGSSAPTHGACLFLLEMDVDSDVQARRSPVALRHVALVSCVIAFSDYQATTDYGDSSNNMTLLEVVQGGVTPPDITPPMISISAVSVNMTSGKPNLASHTEQLDESFWSKLVHATYPLTCTWTEIQDAATQQQTLATTFQNATAFNSQESPSSLVQSLWMPASIHSFHIYQQSNLVVESSDTSANTNMMDLQTYSPTLVLDTQKLEYILSTSSELAVQDLTAGADIIPADELQLFSRFAGLKSGTPVILSHVQHSVSQEDRIERHFEAQFVSVNAAGTAIQFECVQRRSELAALLAQDITDGQTNVSSPGTAPLSYLRIESLTDRFANAVGLVQTFTLPTSSRFLKSAIVFPDFLHSKPIVRNVHIGGAWDIEYTNSVSGFTRIEKVRIVMIINECSLFIV